MRSINTFNYLLKKKKLNMMNTSDIKLRKKGLTRKSVSESLKKLRNSWQLCTDFAEFDLILKELCINGSLTNKEECKFREDRKAQGKSINSSNYTNNQRLKMVALKECIRKRESLRNELLREKEELIKEIDNYKLATFNPRSSNQVNDDIMYNTYIIR